MVKVMKHSSMGCAVVSLDDAQLRHAIIAQGHQGIIDGVQVEIKPHKKKEHGEQKFDVFIMLIHFRSFHDDINLDIMGYIGLGPSS